ncbi:MAG: DUF423 domain-containing protein [Sphingobacteriales bacterium]|jgi:uncharacterized membrane protein YgdD (TMEM256/DUF423 family)
MHRGYIKLGAFLSALSVLMGAFASHLLKKYLGPDGLGTFQTGVQYQFYHSIALLITGILLKRYPNQLVIWAGRLFVLGIIFFSGSLYLLALLESFKGIGLGAFGLLTPIGGLFFVAGWILLLVGVPSEKSMGND